MSECLFCGIIAGKIPTNKVFENEDALALLDINPRNPGHTLVVPKKHYETLMDMPEKEAGKYFEAVKKVTNMVQNAMQAHGISLGQSNGKVAGQVVPHVHFHIIPRFATEGPRSIEEAIPPKRLDEESMKKIAETIKNTKTEVKKEPEKTEPPTELRPKRSREDEVNFNF